jgi:predicted glutamine amidotransferase
MCRLYGFRANEPTKVECTLVHAQNALMVQSREDSKGYSHAHGWGIVTYMDDAPQVERQAWAAYHGEHFRHAAARVHARTVLAHVRRATVGEPRPENTHPFTDGQWSLIHNGTIPYFSRVREILLEATAPEQRSLIRGVTDSEHVFHYLRSLQRADPDAPLPDIVQRGVSQIVRWCRDIDAGARIGLNIMMTDGDELAGTRLGRTLYMVERDGVHDCEICGFPHVHHEQGRRYQAVVIASEPISHECWQEIPEASVYRVNERFQLEIKPLFAGA